ncbi:GTP-binding protein [Micromonospora sp. NPDC047620]|uniref:GTP-binding protein n=1 Tax=Micromonospora sp. NPDC047620 TaxID=3364251 RepID=UPI00371A34D0
MERTLNLGIVAHVDAGKTSLTERLLYAAGIIDTVGSVDAGSTQTDTLELERRRGITIRSAVVSFEVGGVTVNLIDTPGHPDFIAEVERALAVLDGAVLVVSAVEGVQAQTRVLMRTLRRLGIPTLVFVNKIDRTGARAEALITELADRLTPAVVPTGSVTGLGTRAACFVPYPQGPDLLRLADHDDGLLTAYVEGRRVSRARRRRALVALTRRGRIHPVLFGSAVTGAGVDELLTVLPRLLPATAADPIAPLSGTVFKVDRGPAGERVAYVRMVAGTLRVRDRLRLPGGGEGRVSGLAVFDHGGCERVDALIAGRIGRVTGLSGVRIGDPVGTPPAGTRHRFPPPTLETVVVPVRAGDRGALHAALTELAEQDPLINLRVDELRQELSVSLYGEVQKEVVQATLAEGYGLDVAFEPSTVICVERLVGTGEAVEFVSAGHPFLATVGLRVEPAPVDAGVTFRLAVEPGAMPYAFFVAVEATVRETLRQGVHGWEVPDCVVTMTHSGYCPRQSAMHARFDKSMSSTGADFRGLTPLVLMDALRRAGTRVHEPVHAFRVDVPADLLGTVLPVLARCGAVPTRTEPQGTAYVVEGEVPAARVHDLERRLPALTRGEGTLESRFSHHQPVRGPAPERPRSDHDPLHRKEYLLAVTRRVTV